MAGFPAGFNPGEWMGDLAKRLGQERMNSMKVTEFKYPGSHDAATYGEGMADFSYQCQDKNFYEQMKVGQRAFDLRLALKDNHKQFIPVHGMAKGTADNFNETPKTAKDSDLAGQIMKFAKEKPTEILIFKVTLDGVDHDEGKEIWADTAMALLGERLLPPGKTGATYGEAMESKRNIVLAFAESNLPGGEKSKHPLAQHYWDVGRTSPVWIGNNNPSLWNEPVWQSGDIKKVVNSTEEWMEKNKTHLQARDKFWVAFCQLTPALGQDIGTFFKDGASVRPKDLALGGGLSILSGGGKSGGSNKELREMGVFKKQIWRDYASCVLYDFCDTQTTGQIVAMNLGGGGGGDGGGNGGRAQNDNDDEGRGGGGRGGHGGRGGRGGGHEEGHGGRGRGRGRGHHE